MLALQCHQNQAAPSQARDTPLARHLVTLAATASNATAQAHLNIEQVCYVCADVMAAVARLLQAMDSHGVPIDVSDSGPLPGMFVLSAHNDRAVRSLVIRAMVAKLEPLQAGIFDEGHDQWGQLVDSWVRCPMLCLCNPDIHAKLAYTQNFNSHI